ncbi:MAG: hypothetical protein ACREFW_02430 [Rhizomicrobium sp.]
MTLSDKSGVLRNFLGALPEQAASKLARAVEMDRLMDGTGLPHEAILMGLRSSLRNVRPPSRTQTPQRLFCQPFEDLLSSEARSAKQKGVVARASVTPVWTWILDVLLPQEAQNYIHDVKALILAAKHEEAIARAEIFCAAAASAMGAAFADTTALKALSKRLGQDALADAREMALLLAEGPEMRKVQERLPKPHPRLAEDIVWQLRDSYDTLIARNPDAAPYVAVVAMNRLQRPCEALRLPLLICRQTGDALISRTDMGLVGEILFGRMDSLQGAIMAAKPNSFDAETLLAQVATFSDLSSSVVKEIEVRRNGQWGQRLLKDRAAVGNVMDGFMDRAVKEIVPTLPMQKGTSDFSRLAPPEKRVAAFNYARLVGGARRFAAAASFAAKQKTTWEEISNHLRRYIEDAVKELKRPDGERRKIAEAQLNYCAELAAVLFSAEEAELIHRRVRAAQTQAA